MLTCYAMRVMWNLLTTAFYAAQILIDLALTLAVILGARFIFRTYKQWNLESKEEKNRETRRQLAVAAHKVVDSIQRLRTPLWEFEKHDDPQPHTHELSTRFYEERWRTIQHTLHELMDIHGRCTGANPELDEAVVNIQTTAERVYQSIRTYLAGKMNGQSPAIADDVLDEVLDEVFAAPEGEEDKIKQRLYSYLTTVQKS